MKKSYKIDSARGVEIGRQLKALAAKTMARREELQRMMNEHVHASLHEGNLLVQQLVAEAEGAPEGHGAVDLDYLEHGLVFITFDDEDEDEDGVCPGCGQRHDSLDEELDELDTKVRGH
jgi:hypothetical protein